MKQDMIGILDLGSHENTVVARAIRALGVYSEIYPHDISAEELKLWETLLSILAEPPPQAVKLKSSIRVNAIARTLLFMWNPPLPKLQPQLLLWS